ncbi:hypothetical protein F4703DRAFT_1834421 [Phycomyces blakesleeanus]
MKMVGTRIFKAELIKELKRYYDDLCIYAYMHLHTSICYVHIIHLYHSTLKILFLYYLTLHYLIFAFAFKQALIGESSAWT